MTVEELKKRIPESEIRFYASRSSGPGGQNVNKLNTRVELRFNIMDSDAFSEYEKSILYSKLKHRISTEGDLIVKSQSERSQLRNRNHAVEKLFQLLCTILTEKKPRKPTQPTRKSIEERLDRKRRRSYVKKSRESLGDND
ncbi:MAG: alternative ribosome rescue aminoacyl-tRNA hydrolase ArfB [Bacteroidales bacterium]|mgnify:CR=1 FL=1|jgi:ribosome-associated protein|nr:alternative ribosome rescue aminoacyl-tRNA hydrolase ArfB [Bacteroidales bacterium]